MAAWTAAWTVENLVVSSVASMAVSLVVNSDDERADWKAGAKDAMSAVEKVGVKAGLWVALSGCPRVASSAHTKAAGE